MLAVVRLLILVNQFHHPQHQLVSLFLRLSFINRRKPRLDIVQVFVFAGFLFGSQQILTW